MQMEKRVAMISAPSPKEALENRASKEVGWLPNNFFPRRSGSFAGSSERIEHWQDPTGLQLARSVIATDELSHLEID